MVILFSVFVIFACINGAFIIWLFHHWKSLPEHLPVQKKANTSVTVLIPFKNEKRHLPGILKAMSSQTYPASQVEYIFINDHSTDSGEKVIMEYQGNYENFRVLHLEDETGKKQALIKGIEASQGELIVTTDADCTMGPNWISSMVSFYETHSANLIIGPVIHPKPSGWFSSFQYLEQSVLTGIAASSARANIPLLCSGANLAYPRKILSAFNDPLHISIPSGDDMFLLENISQKFPGTVCYLKSKDAIVETHYQRNLSHLFKQRSRWAGKIFAYHTPAIKYAAYVAGFVNFILLASLVLIFIDIRYLVLFFTVYIMKTLPEYFYAKSIVRWFEKKLSFSPFAVLEVGYFLYVSAIIPFTFITKTSWGKK